MILHIGFPSKFFDRAIALFGDDQHGASMFLEFDRETYDFSFFDPKSETRTPVSISDLQTMTQFKVVIFHSFTEVFADALNAFEGRAKLIWLGWGFDYYKLLYPSKYLLFTERTLEFYIDKVTALDRSEVEAEMRERKPSDVMIESVSKFDFICPLFYPEYELIKSLYATGKFPDFAFFRYQVGDYDSLLPSYEKAKGVERVKICVGNSGAAENNHLDSIARLKAEGYNNFLVPASYGNTKYINALKETFSDDPSANYEFIDDYMSVVEYASHIAPCLAYASMSIRQIGVGTIMISMFLGVPVILNKRNPLYAEVKSKNLPVLCFDDLTDNPDILEQHRRSSNVAEVREIIIREYWGANVIKNFADQVDLAGAIAAK